MKRMLALALAAVMASGAMAFEFGDDFDTMSIFFDGEAWTGAFDTNSDVVSASPFAGPFAYAYLVLINPSVETLLTVEFGVKHSAPDFAIDGWSNVVLYGPTPNYIAQADMMGGTGLSAIYTWPSGFPLEQGGATVLLRWRLLNYLAEPNTLSIGPLRHLSPSIAGRYVYDAPEGIILCTPPVDWELLDAEGYAVVAGFMGGAADVIATEDHTLSGVKSLFR